MGYCVQYCTVCSIVLCAVLYCVQYCTVCSAVLCAVLYCVQYCTVCSIVLCAVLFCVQYCTVWSNSLYTVVCAVLYYASALLFTLLHCVSQCLLQCSASYNKALCWLQCKSEPSVCSVTLHTLQPCSVSAGTTAQLAWRT